MTKSIRLASAAFPYFGGDEGESESVSLKEGIVERRERSARSQRWWAIWGSRVGIIFVQVGLEFARAVSTARSNASRRDVSAAASLLEPGVSDADRDRSAS